MHKGAASFVNDETTATTNQRIFREQVHGKVNKQLALILRGNTRFSSLFRAHGATRFDYEFDTTQHARFVMCEYDFQ